MPLVDETLFGTRDKVAISIERLKAHEPAEGYYLAFSGGKDSVTLYRLAEMAGIKFDAHYNNTTVDPPELVRFIKRQYPKVERHQPEMSMFRLIVYKGWPPLRQQRWCCELLKEGSGHGRIVLTGVRWEESVRRRKYTMVQSCEQKRAIYVRPILDWSTEDVWEFIRREDIPYCPLYDEGFERLGCILCPMAGKPERDIARWPQFAKAYIRTFDQLLAERLRQGKKTTFTTGQELFDWWITRHSKAASDDQARLFD